MPARGIEPAHHCRVANFKALYVAGPGQLDVLGTAGYLPALSPPRVFVAFKVNALANVDPLLKVRVVGLLGGNGDFDLTHALEVVNPSVIRLDDYRIGAGLRELVRIMPILAGVFDPLAITVVLERKEGAVWRIGDAEDPPRLVVFDLRNPEMILALRNRLRLHDGERAFLDGHVEGHAVSNPSVPLIGLIGVFHTNSRRFLRSDERPVISSF